MFGSRDWTRPSQWEDEERMSNLMALFKKREVNPRDFENRLEFWTELIHSSAAELKDPIVTVDALYRRFLRNRKVPAGLATVLDSMLQSGEAERLSDWEARGGGWLSWGVSSLAKPVGWLLGASSAVLDKSTPIVLPSLIRSQAEAILERHAEAREGEDPLSRGIVEYNLLLRRTRDICASEKALGLALTQLERDGQISRGTSPGGQQIVKFRESRDSGPVEVTEMDKSVVSLNAAAAKTEKEITAIDAKIAKLKSEAKACVSSGNRTRAKALLRQKAMWEKKLNEKDAQLGNLQGLLHKVANTHDHKIVLDAYRSGVSAFKKNMERHGLSPANIDQTMDDIHETMEDYNEISDAIGSGFRAGGDLASDAELEDELADLIGEPEPAAPKGLKRPANGGGEMDWPSVPADVSLEPELSPPAAKKPPLDRLAQLRAQLNAA